MTKQKPKASTTAESNLPVQPRQNGSKNSGELANLLRGVESEEVIAERSQRLAEVIQGILRGEVKPSLDPDSDAALFTPKFNLSSLVGVASAVPASFTIAQLQSLFNAQSINSKQQQAQHMAVLSLFRGLLGGPVDSISATAEPVKEAVSTELAGVYAQRSPYQEARGRAAVRRDLRLHRAYDPDAQGMSETNSVWQKLTAVPFSPTSFARVFTCMAYLREGFALQRANNGLIDPDQKGNWLHTMDEIDAVLDCTRGKPASEVERALMGMFGDSWKTKFNFTRHNYDGAEVARIVLSRTLDHEFTAADVIGIVEANKEHQVSPPALMGVLYTNKIAGLLNAERAKLWGDLIEKSKTGELNHEEQRQLGYWTEVAMEQDYRQFQLALLKEQAQQGTLGEKELAIKKRLEDRARFGSFTTDEDYEALGSLQRKIADPYAHDLEGTAAGGMAVRLTERERALLRLSGIDHWHIPHESTAWYWISRTGVVADILANLGLGGRCKLTRLNGPETDPVFQFPTIHDCVVSGLKTYSDISRILKKDEHEYINARLNTMNTAIERAMKRLADWLRSDGTLKDNPELIGIPFWDVPLKYPVRGNDEANWWATTRIPEAQRTPAEQQFWEAHRYDGLSEREKSDYLRAIRIRDRAVEELGRELRLDDRFVPDFKPVMSRRLRRD